MAQEWPGDGAGRRSTRKGRVTTVAMESTGEIASVPDPGPHREPRENTRRPTRATHHMMRAKDGEFRE